jgi:hypothetical protein
MTLALDGSAKAGDTLELEVTTAHPAHGVRARGGRRGGHDRRRLGATGAEPDRAPDQLSAHRPAGALAGKPCRQPPAARRSSHRRQPARAGAAPGARAERAVLRIAPGAVGARQARNRRAAARAAGAGGRGEHGGRRERVRAREARRRLQQAGLLRADPARRLPPLRARPPRPQARPAGPRPKRPRARRKPPQAAAPPTPRPTAAPPPPHVPPSTRPQPPAPAPFPSA